MGLEDIFGKELKEARQLGESYWDLADKYGLDYIPGVGNFIILSNKRLSEDSDHRKSDTPPWPGIKIHSPLSVKMYNILRSDDFTQMLKNGEIDGIKVYLYDDDSIKHKEVTIYMSPNSLPYYKELINIFKKNGIFIEPVLPFYNDMVYLNRMHIAPNEGIFVRYSTDFTEKMNISDIKNIRDSMMSNIDTKNINQVKILEDYMIGTYMDKIHDEVWRAAADESHPYIVAVSKSWLLNNQYNLDEILGNSYTSLKDFYYKLWKNADPKELLGYSPTIYTFITLKEIGGTIVSNPNIIISYDNYNKQLEAYSILDAVIVRYDLSNREDRERISDHPKDRLYKFLKYGTAYP